MMAMIALRSTLPSKRKSLKADLQNQRNTGSNQHPTDLNHVMKLLQIHVAPKAVVGLTKEDDGSLTLHQAEKAQVKGLSGKLRANVKCMKCRRLGNFQKYCPFVSKDKNEVEG